MRRVILKALLALWLLGMLVPSGALAAPSGPSWTISDVSYPTNFRPSTVGIASEQGPAYHVVAVNTGDAATSAPFQVVVTLPTGVTLSPGQNVEAPLYGRQNRKVQNQLKCSVVGQTVTCEGPCTTEGTVCPEGPALGPGERLQLNIPVKVGPESVVHGGPLVSTAVVSGGGAAMAETKVETVVSTELSPFSFLPDEAGMSGFVGDAARESSVTAGAHPYQMEIHLGFPQNPAGTAKTSSTVAAGGGVRDVSVALPPGVVVNPSATPKCKEAELDAELCLGDTQIGTLRFNLGEGGNSTSTKPLYNIVAPPGTPAEFGVTVLQGITVHLFGELADHGGYILSAGSNDILAKLGIYSVDTTLWGNPSDASHDTTRGPCINSNELGEPLCALAERSNVPLITMPSACSGPLVASARADSWVEPGVFSERAFSLVPEINDCGSLEFGPNITLQPESTVTDSPTGLAVRLQNPQKEEYEEGGLGSEVPGRATSTLKDARVVLPAGVSVNPSAVNGRTACTASQVGLLTPVGQPNASFTTTPDECPGASKVGSVEVETPLLDHPLPGSIYLAAPFQNPFNSLLAIYIAVDDPQTGLVVKLPGHVEADAATGQLTTTVSENPQLPFNEFRLNFFGGPRAALRTPMTCGSYASLTTLTPWSGGSAVVSSDNFPVTSAPGGGACATSEGQLPNAPSFTAGSSDPLAGAYSPFVLRLSRNDGSQQFGALNVTLPKGMAGKLVNTPYCPESALAAAATRSGRAEEQAPSCPAASEVGKVTVGVGAGPLPYYTQGRAYWAGPYKGAPLSLAIIAPAVAGPYDLGTVVVRSAIFVDPYTAQITVRSDPLPRILDGIPLDIRSAAVEVGKQEFILNPSSCEAKEVTAEVISTVGQAAHLANRFQVGECAKLKFKPKVAISLKGATKRAGHPALKAVVTTPKKGAYANIARAQVALPPSAFLDQGNLNKVCTQGQLKSATCPASSVYGKVKAWTPLLAKPLTGNVYLGVGFGYKLPALVAELNGQIRVLLAGKVDTTKQRALRNTFETVPDAPVEKFILEMKGGPKYGLFENSENICRKPQKASVVLTAQNGRISRLSPTVSNSCKKGKTSGQKGGKKSKRH
jgi:hypothetical protein